MDMELKYRYKKTSKIARWLDAIEKNRETFSKLPSREIQVLRFQRESLLKSAVYSAKIEGNRLSFEEAVGDLGNDHDQSREKQEISNLYGAYRQLYKNPSRWNVSLETIKRWHALVMGWISGDAGRFRQEQSAIFNQAGVAIYLPPPPQQIKELLESLVQRYTNMDEPVPIKAAIIHFGFEKVHPFLDGNGRVGRLLSHQILIEGGYDFRGLLVLEEYINEHRSSYYDELLVNKKDITGFVEFWLEAMVQTSSRAIEPSVDLKQPKVEEGLLPRRAEILALIRDHEIVSFDFIRRRFLAVPESTLHYDVRILMQKGLVIKRGTTRGAVYSPR